MGKVTKGHITAMCVKKAYVKRLSIIVKPIVTNHIYTQTSVSNHIIPKQYTSKSNIGKEELY